MWFILIMQSIHMGWKKEVHGKIKEQIVALKQMGVSDGCEY